MFGNPIASPASSKKTSNSQGSKAPSLFDAPPDNASSHGSIALPSFLQNLAPVNESNDEESSEAPVAFFKTLKDVEHTYYLVNTPERINELTNKLSNQIEICFDTETTLSLIHI